MEVRHTRRATGLSLPRLVAAGALVVLPFAATAGFPWKTSSSMAQKCFLLLLSLDDGQVHEAFVKFAK